MSELDDDVHGGAKAAMAEVEGGAAAMAELHGGLSLFPPMHRHGVPA